MDNNFKFCLVCEVCNFGTDFKIYMGSEISCACGAFYELLFNEDKLIMGIKLLNPEIKNQNIEGDNESRIY